MEIELIDQIVDYFKLQAALKHHPWATRFCISICSNGVLYFDPRVQRFLQKNQYNMSFSVTIDGDKELHDSCRVFPDGSPSYDYAIAAAKDWMSKGNYMGSKITIAPGNITHLFKAIVHMVEFGYTEINANVVYEKGWTLEHAKIYYEQLKKIADYWDENNLYETVFLSLFEERFFRPKNENDTTNWCGGTGCMLSIDPDGRLFPCIRYMESSLGDDAPPFNIGDVNEGIGQTEEFRERIKCLDCITRKTQSTEECFNCPIADGCSWCSAYNYQEFGTPDKRATYICDIHKTRSLANVYFWNRYYRKSGYNKYFKLWCPDEWALTIIDEDELNMLKEISKPLNDTCEITNNIEMSYGPNPSDSDAK
jgi:radical SAM peptide maturase (CXXX-repeat target family)